MDAQGLLAVDLGYEEEKNGGEVKESFNEKWRRCSCNENCNKQISILEVSALPEDSSHILER